MKGFFENIEKLTLENSDFRRVLYTGRHSQLVLMCISPGDEIGFETHDGNDQFFRFEHGQGSVIIDGSEYGVSDGSVVIVPAGAKHNVINISKTENLKLYTIYSPPHHKDQIVRKTRGDAALNEEDFDGKTTE